MKLDRTDGRVLALGVVGVLAAATVARVGSAARAPKGTPTHLNAFAVHHLMTENDGGYTMPQRIPSVEYPHARRWMNWGGFKKGPGGALVLSKRGWEMMQRHGFHRKGYWGPALPEPRWMAKKVEAPRRTLAQLLATLPGRSGSRALSARAREQMPPSDFVFPKTRRYPISDRDHGKKALTMATWSATSRRDLPAVKRAVFARYPGLRSWWNNTPWVREHPQQAARGRRAA